MTLVLIVALVTGAILFGIGVYGALSQTNLVMIMMGVELILAGALVNLVAFWRFLHPESYSGQMFVVMTVMAVEMAVGFGVAIARFRAKGSVEMEEAGDLKG